MRLKWRLYVIALVTMLSWMACRKSDMDMEKQQSKNMNVLKFFTQHQSADPYIRAVTGCIQRKNEKYGFVDKIIKQIGYPYWDRAMRIEPPRKNAYTETEPDSVNLTYIPFVRDGQHYVNAALIVKTTPADTVFHYLQDWQFSTIAHDSIFTGWNARDVFLAFATLDNAVFNRDRFVIKDTSIFSPQVKDYIQVAGYPMDQAEVIYRLERTNTSNQLTELLDPMQVCYLIPTCVDITTIRNGPGESTGDGTCDVGQELFIFEDCVTLWVDIETGGGGYGGSTNGPGGDTGGSGSGGGGGLTPPPPNCIPPIIAEDVTEPTPSCPSGWIPVGGQIPDPNNPCSSIDRSSGASSTLQYTLLAAKVSQFTPFDPNTNTQPEQYFVVNYQNGSYTIGPIGTVSTTGGTMNGAGTNTIIVVHTHPYGGYPFPSPSDFLELASFSSTFQMHYIIGYDGTKYAMVVNSYSQLQAFVAANPNAISQSGGFNQSSSLGSQSNNIRNLLIAQGYSADEAYERTLAFLMKQAGVTLVKAQPNSNTFKKIGLKQKSNPDGTPMYNANNQPVYENADCP